jgi:ABC-2 type transport system ATP-binding protein
MNARIPRRLESGPYAVRTTALTKRFGRSPAVRDVELTVPEGAFYLLLGPNGAGKTTTFRMLLGLLRPTSGHAEVCGVRSGPDGAVRALIGVVPETSETPFGTLRVSEVVAHHAGYYRNWDHSYAKRLSEVLELRMDARFGKLSKGQARRVQILLALAHRPRLLLLDEPTDGLDPVIRDTVQRILIDHMADSPTTIILATHLVYEMERFADHVGVLRDGRLVAQVTRSELQQRLRRYVLDVPEDWQPAALPELALMVQNGSPRERRWTVWGEEGAVTAQLEGQGARVRAVNSLTLDEAAIALLSGKAGDA